MSQNIQNFYKVAQEKDFARIFQFRVRQIGNTGLFNEDQLVYLETANLPGRSINNITVPYMGLQFNIPGTASYPGSSNYAVTFRCDSSYKIRHILEKELFQTFNDNTSTGRYSTPGIGSILQMELYTPGTAGVVGNQSGVPQSFGTNDALVRTYLLYGVYIQNLADTQYDIKDNGAIATINATLCYQFWRSIPGKAAKDSDLIPLGF